MDNNERSIYHVRLASHFGYLVVWVGIISLFAVAYWLLSYVPGHGSPQLEVVADPLVRFLDALYFSVITGATVGFGDIVPIGLSRALAAIEGITSFVLLAIFVARLSSRRQDVALDNIHRLTFDSSFHSIRQGLFVARKDLDLIMRKLNEGVDLSEKDWLNIRTAFRQMQIFVKLVPNFYSHKHKVYVIDADREMLILDSVQRCLSRAHEVMEGLSASKHPLHNPCVKELQVLLSMVESIFTSAEHRVSDTENLEQFEVVLATTRHLRAVCG